MTPAEVKSVPVDVGGLFTMVHESDETRRNRLRIHFMAWLVAVADLNRVHVYHIDGKCMATDRDPRAERIGVGTDFLSAMVDWCRKNQVELPSQW